MSQGVLELRAEAAQASAEAFDSALLAVEDGQEVAEGDLVVVIEAMKMEQPINAHKAGVVSGLTAAIGETVGAGAVLCDIKGA